MECISFTHLQLMHPVRTLSFRPFGADMAVRSVSLSYDKDCRQHGRFSGRAHPRRGLKKRKKSQPQQRELPEGSRCLVAPDKVRLHCIILARLLGCPCSCRAALHVFLEMKDQIYFSATAVISSKTNLPRVPRPSPNLEATSFRRDLGDDSHVHETTCLRAG